MTWNLQRLQNGILRTLFSLLPLVLMVILTLATYWLVEKNALPSLPSITPARLHVPDYTITNGALKTLNELGETKNRVIGKKLIHFEDDATIDINAPRMRSFQPPKVPITVQADFGHLDGDISILDLSGHAEIFRPAQAAQENQRASARMIMLSDYFQVLINEDLINTRYPLTLEQGLSILTSNEGGSFNNVTQTMTLFGKVQGRIEREQQGQR